MREYINIKHTIICLGIAATIFIMGIIIVKTDSTDSKENNDKYIKETVLLSADGKEMLLDEAVFLTKNKQAYYEAYYLSAGQKINWNATDKDGVVFKDLVLDESLLFVKEMFLFSEYAKTHGIELTEQDLNTIASSVNEFLSDSSENVIKATHANSDLLNRIYTRTAYHDKLCEQIYNDTDLNVSDDEARQCLIAAAEFSPENFDSPERTAAKVVERVNSGEVIGEVAKIYDNEVKKGNVGKGTWNENELEKFCLSLKDGECKMIEINGSYYVIYCYMENDNDATEADRTDLITKRKEKAISDFMNELTSKTNITVNTEAWSTINFDKTIITSEDLKK